MNKQELLDFKIKAHEKEIEAIKALPEIDIDGVEYASPIGEAKLWVSGVNGMDGLTAKLHLLRQKLGHYILTTYWISGGRVYTEYKFGNTLVHIGIHTDSPENVILHLSAGKCHVVDEVTQKVVCNL